MLHWPDDVDPRRLHRSHPACPWGICVFAAKSPRSSFDKAASDMLPIPGRKSLNRGSTPRLTANTSFAPVTYRRTCSLSAACSLPTGWIFVLPGALGALGPHYTNRHVLDTPSAYGTRNRPESSGPTPLTGERQVCARSQATMHG
jgi:hypothetical protein